MHKNCITAASLIFLFAASFLSGIPVGGRQSEAAETKGITVVASFYPVYITVKNVTKGVPGVSVANLTPPLTGCLHDYALTADDMKKLSDARIFVANGAGMESFLDKITAQRPGLKIMELSGGIPLIEGEGGKGKNPHVWVSISNVIVQAKNLGKAMEEFDPGHREIYKKNVSAYTEKLEELKRKMHAELASYKGRPIITFHEAFPYFAREFGLKITAVIQKEPGSEPSAREIAGTIDIIKKTGAAALFSEPQYSASAAKTIARETGAKIYALDPAVTGTDDCDAYLKIMAANLEVLKKAFQN